MFTQPESHQVYEPTLVPFNNQNIRERKPLEKAVQIEVGLQHCFLITDQGNVYAWGKSDKGQLGVGKLEVNKIISPMRIGPLTDVVGIAAGFSHAAAIDRRGHFYVWGKGMSDQPKSAAGRFDVVTDQKCFLVHFT